MAPSVRAISIPVPRPNASLRLLCFPFAGAGANVFRGWERSLGDSIEVVVVQLPGREWRRNERPITRMNDLVDLLAPEIRNRISGAGH